MSYLGETVSASTTNIPSSWDFPQNISTIFPKSDPDRLSGEGNYHVWAVRMENAFEVCGLLDVVSGAMPRPPPGDVNDAIWLKMNASARTVIAQCISSSLVMKVSHFRDAKDIWSTLGAQYTRTGAGSIVYWFSRLSNPMQPTDDISAHIMAFQDAYHHLENSNFVIPESCAAGLLLSTLYKDPGDPRSWDYFIEGTWITETTTLSSIVNLLLEEKLRRSSANTTVETAVVDRSCGDFPPNKKWCRNCQRPGHIYEECWNVGGGKEGQWPEREQTRESGSRQRGRRDVDGEGRRTRIKRERESCYCR